MDDKKTTFDYLSVFFRPYTIVVYLCALSLLVHLLPSLFPTITAQDLIIGILESLTTVLAVYLGWKLSQNSEKLKRKEDMNMRISSIVEELNDLIEPMRLISSDNFKYAQQAMSEPLSKFLYTVSMPHTTPAFDEHFRHVLPMISPAKRRNIRAITNYVGNYNHVLNILKNRLQEGYKTNAEKARDYLVCSQIALKIYFCCKWLVEKDGEVLIDFEDEFFKAYKEEVSVMTEFFKGKTT